MAETLAPMPPSSDILTVSPTLDSDLLATALRERDEARQQLTQAQVVYFLALINCTCDIVAFVSGCMKLCLSEKM